MGRLIDLLCFSMFFSHGMILTSYDFLPEHFL